MITIHLGSFVEFLITTISFAIICAIIGFCIFYTDDPEIANNVAKQRNKKLAMFIIAVIVGVILYGSFFGLFTYVW